MLSLKIFNNNEILQIQTIKGFYVLEVKTKKLWKGRFFFLTKMFIKTLRCSNQNNCSDEGEKKPYKAYIL